MRTHFEVRRVLGTGGRGSIDSWDPAWNVDSFVVTSDQIQNCQSSRLTLLGVTWAIPEKLNPKPRKRITNERHETQSIHHATQ